MMPCLSAALTPQAAAVFSARSTTALARHTRAIHHHKGEKPHEATYYRPSEIMGHVGHLLLAATLALALLPLAPHVAAAASPPVVQTFYTRLPRTSCWPCSTRSGAANWGSAHQSHHFEHLHHACRQWTIIYYNHWEDGYEADINNPIQSTTQIWGDSNPANGIPPGFATDVINAGNVFILTNDVAVSGGNVRSPPPTSITVRTNSPPPRALPSAGSIGLPAPAQHDPVHPGLRYQFWGMEYRVPVGTNTASSYTMFEYTAVAVMAGKGGAHVEVDVDGDGTYETTGITLAEGQSYLSASTLVQGAGIRSTDNPIQVNFLTGDINSGQYYESRDGALLPTSLWSSDYYTPVSTSTSSGYSTESSCTTLPPARSRSTGRAGSAPRPRPLARFLCPPTAAIPTRWLLGQRCASITPAAPPSTLSPQPMLRHQHQRWQ